MDDQGATRGSSEPSNDEWLTVRQAAASIKLTKNTLDTHHSQGRGARFHRNGRMVRSHHRDLYAYISREIADG